MKKINNIILIFSIIYTAIIMINEGQPSSISWFIDIAGIFAWSILPYLLLILLNKIIKNSNKSDIVIFITSIVVSGFAVFVLINTFFIHPDAQGALIFIFLPAYQLGIGILGSIIAIILKIFQKKDNRAIQ